MEYDRYKGNNKLYILGISSLILCLGLFFFSMYLVPFLAWGQYYNVPYFVLTLISTFEDVYYFSHGISRLLVWSLFFIPSVIAGIISYYISNFIDNRLLGIEPEIDEEEIKQHSLEVKQEFQESASLGLKILFLMFLIVVAILIIQFIL